MPNLTLSSIDPYKLFYRLINILEIRTSQKVHTQLLNRLLQFQKNTKAYTSLWKQKQSQIFKNI